MTGLQEGMKDPTAAAHTAPQLPRALIIDDEPQVAMILRRMIARDVSAEIVHSCEAAMTRFREGLIYDVIICDLMMPGMTGMQLYALLKESFPAQARRMVFMSGGAFTEASRSFLDSVHNPRIEKPFDVATARAALAAVLQEDPLPPA